MAVTVVTPQAMARHVASPSLAGLGVVATTPTDGWTINAVRGADECVVVLEADPSGDTVVFPAGDRPPGHEPDNGSVSVVLGASQIKIVQLSTSRLLKKDGTIRATCTDAGTRLAVLNLARGH